MEHSAQVSSTISAPRIEHARRRSRVGRGALLALALIVGCLFVEVVLLRVGIDDLDEGYFVQQATRVLHGQVPFRDFETLYSPGLAYLHAAFFALLGGPNLVAARALGLATRAALALALFAIARPLVGNPLWAAVPALFLLVGLDDAPERWEPHPGWLSALGAVLAAWVIARGTGRRALVAAGALIAASYAFKQNTGVFMLLAALAWLMTSKRTQRAQDIATLLGSFAAVTAVWLVPLAIATRDSPGRLGVLFGAVNQAGLVSPPEQTMVVPLLCVAAGAALAWRGTSTLRWYLLAALALFATQYPRMDTLHLAWSAPLLLVLGVVAADRMRPWNAALVVLFLAIEAYPMVAARAEFAALPRRPVANVEAPAQTAIDLTGLVGDLRQRTRPGEPIFVYPTSPLIYVLADRANPTRFDHLNPGAATPAQLQQVIDDLEASRVPAVVVSDFWEQAWGEPGPNAALEDWIASHFVEAARYGPYRVLVPA